MRVVFDTNVFVSGLVFGGKPRESIESAMMRFCRMIVSDAILKELERILSNKFGWDSGRARLAIMGIRDTAEMVEPHLVLTDCADPDDNRILEAAVEGRADCVVSGDKRHLLRMKIFRGIEILTVNDFLLRLESAPSQGL